MGWSIKNLLDSVCTDSIPGGRIPDDHFDETRGPPPEPQPESGDYKRYSHLQPIRLDLELIKNRRTGELDWVE